MKTIVCCPGAYVYESVGRRDEAFERLELAYEERDGRLAGIRSNPEMNELRKDPIWTSIETRWASHPPSPNRESILEPIHRLKNPAGPANA